jgi:group I intron endonuclease
MANLQHPRVVKQSGVYIIRNFIDSRIYIGSSVNISDRYYDHIQTLKRQKHHNTIIQRFVNRYGIESIYFEILELCSKEDMISREQYYMDLYKPEFNVRKRAESNIGIKCSEEKKEKIRAKLKGVKTYRGSIGYKPTPETIEKIRQGNTGKKRTAEMLEKQSKRMLGFKHSDEVKLRMSESKKGIKAPPRSIEHCQNISKGKKGKPMSEERRQKQIGRKASDETRQRISAGRKGIKSGEMTEERRRKISEGHKQFWANRDKAAWIEKTKAVWPKRKQNY